MADDVTTLAGGEDSGTSVEAGQSQPSSTEPTSSQSVQPEGDATSGEKASSKPKVNLQEFDEFKEYQAASNRQIEQAKLQARREAERAEALERERDQERMAQMNDYERATYQAQQAEKRAQSLEQRLKEIELANRIRDDLTNLSQRTGVPRDVLEKAPTWQAAQDLAVETMKKNMDAEIKRRVKEARQADNTNSTDVGGGATPPPPDEFAERLASANSAVDYVAAILENNQSKS